MDGDFWNRDVTLRLYWADGTVSEKTLHFLQMSGKGKRRQVACAQSAMPPHSRTPTINSNYSVKDTSQ